MLRAGAHVPTAAIVAAVVRETVLTPAVGRVSTTVDAAASVHARRIVTDRLTMAANLAPPDEASL
jgi:hypothetical protein